MAETRRGRLTLPADGSTSAVLEVEARPRSQRAVRAGLVAAATLVAAPAAFFVPPHFLWPLVVLGAGTYGARREWRGEYVVRSFAGSCPRCGDALTVSDGARIRGRQRLECYGCHREPVLVVDPAPGPAAAFEGGGPSSEETGSDGGDR